MSKKKKKFPYNKPKAMGLVVCTKYRQDTPPEEMKRIREVAHRMAQNMSDVWEWRNGKKRTVLL